MDYSQYFTAPVLSSAIVGVYSYFTGGRNLKSSAMDAGLNLASTIVNEPITELLFDTTSIARNQQQLDTYNMYVKPAIASGIYSVLKTRRDTPNLTISEATPAFRKNLIVSYASNVAGNSYTNMIRKY